MATFSEVEDAFLFVSAGSPEEHAAYICVTTGRTYWHTELGDNPERLPHDIDEPGKYIAIPHKNDFGLGKPLVLKFAAMALPDDLKRVVGMFEHRGAYGRFKQLLERHGKLNEWHAFENESQREALRSWCAANGIKLED